MEAEPSFCREDENRSVQFANSGSSSVLRVYIVVLCKYVL